MTWLFNFILLSLGLFFISFPFMFPKSPVLPWNKFVIKFFISIPVIGWFLFKHRTGVMLGFIWPHFQVQSVVTLVVWRISVSSLFTKVVSGAPLFRKGAPLFRKGTPFFGKGAPFEGLMIWNLIPVVVILFPGNDGRDWLSVRLQQAVARQLGAL